MRLGLDARILAHPKSGISTYLINLIKKFLNFPEIEIFLFGDKPIHPEYSFINHNKEIEKIIFGTRYRKYWAQFFLPPQLKKYKIDIYHAVWNNAVPLFSPCPCIVTIHDLIPWAIPGYFKKTKKRLRYKLQEFSAVHNARLIIADSNHTKSDIIKYLKVPKDKIKVIYLGLESQFQPIRDIVKIEPCLKRFSITKDYIIDTAGVEQLRRNAKFLVRSYFKFIRENRIDLQLVFTGVADPSNKEYTELKELIQALNIEDKVIFTGRVGEEDMVLLLSKAVMMVFPSLYEGFGFPPLEAMACGTPVIATDVASMPEVLDDACLLVDPYNIDDLASTIKRLYFDFNLRRELIQKGLMKVKSFSWQRTAQQTFQLYKQILAR